jgi:hypothetical protein
MRFFKHFFRGTVLHKLWRFLKYRVFLLLGLRSSFQDFKNYNDFVYLGSEYGGWPLHESIQKRKKLNVIAAGAGEDISFEIELLAMDIFDEL